MPFRAALEAQIVIVSSLPRGEGQGGAIPLRGGMRLLLMKIWVKFVN